MAPNREIKIPVPGAPLAATFAVDALTRGHADAAAGVADATAVDQSSIGPESFDVLAIAGAGKAKKSHRKRSRSYGSSRRAWSFAATLAFLFLCVTGAMYGSYMDKPAATPPHVDGDQTHLPGAAPTDDPDSTKGKTPWHHSLTQPQSMTIQSTGGNETVPNSRISTVPNSRTVQPSAITSLNLTQTSPTGPTRSRTMSSDKTRSPSLVTQGEATATGESEYGICHLEIRKMVMTFCAYFLDPKNNTDPMKGLGNDNVNWILKVPSEQNDEQGRPFELVLEMHGKGIEVCDHMSIGYNSNNTYMASHTCADGRYGYMLQYVDKQEFTFTEKYDPNKYDPNKKSTPTNFFRTLTQVPADGTLGLPLNQLYVKRWEGLLDIMEVCDILRDWKAGRSRSRDFMGSIVLEKLTYLGLTKLTEMLKIWNSAKNVNGSPRPLKDYAEACGKALTVYLKSDGKSPPQCEELYANNGTDKKGLDVLSYMAHKWLADVSKLAVCSPKATTTTEKAEENRLKTFNFTRGQPGQMKEGTRKECEAPTEKTLQPASSEEPIGGIVLAEEKEEEEEPTAENTVLPEDAEAAAARVKAVEEAEKRRKFRMVIDNVWLTRQGKEGNTDATFQKDEFNTFIGNETNQLPGAPEVKGLQLALGTDDSHLDKLSSYRTIVKQWELYLDVWEVCDTVRDWEDNNVIPAGGEQRGADYLKVGLGTKETPKGLLITSVEKRGLKKLAILLDKWKTEGKDYVKRHHRSDLETYLAQHAAEIRSKMGFLAPKMKERLKGLLGLNPYFRLENRCGFGIFEDVDKADESKKPKQE
eukprot:GHVO01021607.1.p1 GENE.GHVO01021607.1~~GHVO01021607.1.p1  ORF type:complete len:817 (-),score=122.98 GHVO01021607.1:80-2509(-)